MQFKAVWPVLALAASLLSYPVRCESDRDFPRSAQASALGVHSFPRRGLADRYAPDHDAHHHSTIQSPDMGTENAKSKRSEVPLQIATCEGVRCEAIKSISTRGPSKKSGGPSILSSGPFDPHKESGAWAVYTNSKGANIMQRLSIGDSANGFNRFMKLVHDSGRKYFGLAEVTIYQIPATAVSEKERKKQEAFLRRLDHQIKIVQKMLKNPLPADKNPGWTRVTKIPDPVTISAPGQGQMVNIIVKPREAPVSEMSAVDVEHVAGNDHGGKATHGGASTHHASGAEHGTKRKTEGSDSETKEPTTKHHKSTGSGTGKKP